jgi:hypothetical protein
MRPNRPKEDLPDSGWTKQELLDASGLSAKTFDSLRKAARVRGPSHGGLNWLFSTEDLVALIHRAESGQWTERGGPASSAWRSLLADRGIEVD